MTRWVRNRPERRHDVVAGLAAGVAGVVVGAGVFWLVRVLAAREPLSEGLEVGMSPGDASSPASTRASGAPTPGGGASRKGEA